MIVFDLEHLSYVVNGHGILQGSQPDAQGPQALDAHAVYTLIV
jgi:hypothetical protein